MLPLLICAACSRVAAVVLLCCLAVTSTGQDTLECSSGSFSFSSPPTGGQRAMTIHRGSGNCVVNVPSTVTLENVFVTLDIQNLITLNIRGTLRNTTFAVKPNTAAGNCLLTIDSTATLINAVVWFEVNNLHDVVLKGTWTNATVVATQRDPTVPNGKTTVTINGVHSQNYITAEIGSGNLFIGPLSMTTIVASPRYSNCYTTTIAGELWDSNITLTYPGAVYMSGAGRLVHTALAVVGRTLCAHVAQLVSSSLHLEYSILTISLTAVRMEGNVMIDSTIVVTNTTTAKEAVHLVIHPGSALRSDAIILDFNFSLPPSTAGATTSNSFVNISSHRSAEASRPVLGARAANSCVPLLLGGSITLLDINIIGWVAVDVGAEISTSSLVMLLLSSRFPVCTIMGLTIADTANITQSNVSIQVPNRSTNVVSGTIEGSALSIGSDTMPSSGVAILIRGENITHSNIYIALHYRPTNRIVVGQLGAGTTCNVSGMCYRATIRNIAITTSYITLQSPLRVFIATSSSTILSVIGPVGNDLSCPSESATVSAEATRSASPSVTSASSFTADSCTSSLTTMLSHSDSLTVSSSSQTSNTASISDASLRLSSTYTISHFLSVTDHTNTNAQTATRTTSAIVSSTGSATLAFTMSHPNMSRTKSRRTRSASCSQLRSSSLTTNRTASYTNTVTASVSRSSGSFTHSVRTATPTIPVVPPPAPSTVVEAAATTAAVASGASVVSALLGGSASADAGALAVVGMIACAPPSLRVAVGPMRFVLSPFVDFGGAAMVLGNVGVVAAFALLQAAATNALLVCTSWREDATRFPHLSFLVCMLSLQGVVCGFLIAIADAPTAAGGELAVAVVAIVVAPLFVGAFLLTLYMCAMRCSSVGQYVFNDHMTLSRQFLLPRGRWFPQALVRRFGFAFSSAHTAGSVRLCLAVVAHNVLFVVLSRVPIGSCVAQFALLAAVKVAVLLMLVVCRPLRSHIDHLLDCANHVTLASLLLLLAVDASGVRLAVVSRDAALGSLSMLQGVFTLVKTAHMCFLNYYEVAINDDATPPQDDARRRRGLSLRLLALIDQAADEDRSDFSGTGSLEGLMELDELFESDAFGSDEVDEAIDDAAKRPLEPPPWAMLFEEPQTEVPSLVAANGIFWDEGGAAKSRSDLPAFSSIVDVAEGHDCDGGGTFSASLLCAVPVAAVPAPLKSFAVVLPKAKRRQRRR